MSVREILDANSKIDPQYLPSPLPGGPYLPLVGGTMLGATPAIQNAHTMSGVNTIRGSASLGVDLVIEQTTAGNDISIQTLAGDGVFVDSGAFEVNAVNEVIIAAAGANGITLDAPKLTVDALPAAAPALPNVVSYDTATNQLFYQAAGAGPTGPTGPTGPIGPTGPAGVPLVETLSGSAPSDPNADSTIITDGIHAIPTLGATAGKVKTITNTNGPVLTPYLGSAGEFGAGTPLTFYDPASTFSPVVDIRDIVSVGGTTLAITGRFSALPEIFGTGLNTNGRGIFLYDTATGVRTALGTGLTAGTNSIYPTGTSLHYDAVANRLYVFGGFTFAGGVANTACAAYWDFALSSWVSISAANPPAGSYIAGILVDGPLIYTFGQIQNMSGVPSTSNIAVYNTATNTWAPVGTGMNSASIGGFKIGADIYIYGNMTICSPALAPYLTTECQYFVKWDGAAYSPIGKSPGIGQPFNNNILKGIRNAAGTKIYACGSFTRIASDAPASVFASTIAQYDVATNTWSPMGTGFNVFTPLCAEIIELPSGVIVACPSVGSQAGYNQTARYYNGIASWTPGVSTEWEIMGGAIQNIWKLQQVSGNKYRALCLSAVATPLGPFFPFNGVFTIDFDKIVKITGSFKQALNQKNNLSAIALASGGITRLMFNGTEWLTDVSPVGNGGNGAVAWN